MGMWLGRFWSMRVMESATIDSSMRKRESQIRLRDALAVEKAQAVAGAALVMAAMAVRIARLAEG